MCRMLRVSAIVLLCAAMVQAAAPFRRGDVNQDGRHDIADAIKALGYLFASEQTSCLDAIDVNDDGLTNIADPIKLLNYLFAGPSAIDPPFTACGPDPTNDTLGCMSYAGPGCATPLTVTSITPTSGPVAGGTAVVILGTGFQGGNLQAKLCGVALTSINVVSDTRVQAVTSAGPGGGGVCALQITTSQGTAELASAFTFVAPPPVAIGSVTPTSGPETGGTVLVITGSGFQGGNLRAVLCGTLLSGVRILSNTRMEGTTPARMGGGTCDLTITTNLGSATLDDAFTYEVTPPPDCYTDAELKDLIGQQLGAPICLPSPAWEGEVLGMTVVACPTDRAGGCTTTPQGCEATIDSITPTVDYANGKAQADITGHASLPVDLGSSDCTADIGLGATASMDVIMEDTQWPGIRRVVDVANLAIQVTSFSLDASGGFLCGGLELAAGTMQDTLQQELDARAIEFEAQIEEALVGQYVCP